LLNIYINAYENEELDEVYLVYARFVNVLRQIPTVAKLLPMRNLTQPKKQWKNMWNTFMSPVPNSSF
jgi:F0F1-type ATP synthase gamma subunit